jgi:hypothetical protein
VRIADRTAAAGAAIMFRLVELGTPLVELGTPLAGWNCIHSEQGWLEEIARYDLTNFAVEATS